MANPPVVKSVVECVDGLAGSIRYDGKKGVGVRCEKYPASDEDAKVFAGLTDLEELAILRIHEVSLIDLNWRKPQRY